MHAARWAFALLLGLVLSVGTASLTRAADAYIGVTGTASEDGIVEIVIEDNTSPLAAVYTVTVEVMAGDTSDQTAQNIVTRSRDTLPETFDPRRDDSCVTIRGPFIDIQVLDGVIGQRVELIETPCPASVTRSAPSMGSIAIAMVAAALLVVGVGARSRRRARPA